MIYIQHKLVCTVIMVMIKENAKYWRYNNQTVPISRQAEVSNLVQFQ